MPGRILAEVDLWLMARLSAYDFRYSDDQPREDNGQFGSSGGDSGEGSAGGGDNSEDDGSGGEPVQLAAASGGGRQVATYTDPFGSDAPVVAVSEHGGSLDDAVEQFTVEQAQAMADGLDQMAQVGREASTPSDPHAFDDGPAVLGSVEDGGLRVTAFHDGGGDFGNEGDRFIQGERSGQRLAGFPSRRQRRAAARY